MQAQTDTIRTLVDTDLNAAVEVMSQAFYDDPLWQYLLPDEKARRKLLPVFFTPLLTYGIRGGQTFGVGSPVEGVAVWSYPNQNLTLFGLRTLRLFLTPLRRPMLRAIPILSRFDVMQKRYAPEPHFYLNTIGVRPDAQGKGLASKLIRPFLEQADAQGVGTYTETMTPANVGLYEHYGFRIMEQQTIPATSLNLWAFYREPQG